MTTKQANSNAIQEQSRSGGLSEVRVREQLPVRRPNIDIRELEDAFLIEAEMPGVRASDVELTIENGVLTVSAVAGEPEAAPTGGRFLVREFGRARFERSFRVPDVVDVEAIAAETRHGLLTVRLPKREQARSRRIEVISGN